VGGRGDLTEANCDISGKVRREPKVPGQRQHSTRAENVCQLFSDRSKEGGKYGEIRLGH
jgi:hypothetical protein